LICSKEERGIPSMPRSSDGRKMQGEYERAWGLSNSNRGRRRVRQPRALFFPRKNRCLADFAAGIRRISAKSGEDGRGGALASLSASLSKRLF